MVSSPSPPGRTLSDYVELAGRHRRLLIGLTLAGALGGAGAAMVLPQHYEARTSVQVLPTGLEDSNSFQNQADSDINLDTEAQLVTSTEVASLAAAELGTPEAELTELAEQVSISVPPNTSILDITFVAESAHQARDGAQAFASAYLRHRADSASTRLDEQAEALEPELQQLRQERDNLPAATDDADAESVDLEYERDILDNEISELSSLSTQLRSQSESVGSGRVVSVADLPSTSESPHYVVYIVSGVALGLLLAGAAAAARQRFSSRVWHDADLPQRCGVETLACLPRRVAPKVDDVFGAFGPAGRMFAKLRNEVVAVLGAPRRVIVVAGVSPGSASTTVAANLATALARAGNATTAVSAHPSGTVSVPRLLGTPATPGLSDVFADRADLATATHPAARQPNVEVVGPGASGKAAGPSGDAVTAVYTALRERADYAVVDAAPTSVSAEAQLLAADADAVILAVELGRDRVRDVAEAVQAMRRIEAPLLGAVVLPRTPGRVSEPLTRHDEAAPAPKSHAGRPSPYPRGDALPAADDAPTEVIPAVEEPAEPTAAAAGGGG